MTQPQDPRRHPLQDDEFALARVLRALPTGEPPARVDAAILRAATDAVSQAPRKRAAGLRWLPTWAVGTAAAAVLAVGIGLQLRPPLTPEAAPASVSEAVKPLPQARERLSVDLIEPDRDAAPPPASAPPSLNRSTRPAPPPPPPAPASPPAPAPAPEAFPAPMAPAPAADAADAGMAAEAAAAPDAAGEAAARRMRSEESDQARRVHQEAYARRAQAKAAAESQSRQAAASPPPSDQPPALASAPPPAPPPPAAAAPAAGAGADFAGPAGLPPVADDARLTPAAWLERIRERRRQGDATGARASLRLFKQAHPEAPVPRDLARLP